MFQKYRNTIRKEFVVPYGYETIYLCPQPGDKGKFLVSHDNLIGFGKSVFSPETLAFNFAHDELGFYHEDQCRQKEQRPQQVKKCNQ